MWLLETPKRECQDNFLVIRGMSVGAKSPVADYENLWLIRRLKPRDSMMSRGFVLIGAVSTAGLSHPELTFRGSFFQE